MTNRNILFFSVRESILYVSIWRLLFQTEKANTLKISEKNYT